MARTATITRKNNHVTITVENSDDTFTFETAADGALTEGCERCAGRGSIEHYGHVEQGICFECDGTGEGRFFHNETEATRWAIRTTQARERRARIAAANAESARAARDTWVAENGQLLAGIKRYAEASEWLGHLLADIESGDEYFQGATDSATRTVRAFAHTEALAEAAARDGFVARHVAAEGSKVDLTVSVSRRMTVDGYARNSSTNLILGTVVGGEHDGQSVKIMSTAQWADNAEAGARLHLAGATVKRHSEYRGTPQTTLGGRMKVTAA